MAYQFDFLPVVENTDLLLRGALFTLELTAIGAVLGVGLGIVGALVRAWNCLLYTSPSPRDRQKSRMPSSA